MDNTRWNSCLYEGWVRHRRFLPRRHSFSYKLFMLYLDLDEIPHLFDSHVFYSSESISLAQFRRKDHFVDSGFPLRQSIIQSMVLHTGRKPEGKVFLLTNLRYFGHIFNPVSFYYCFDKSNRYIESIIAEVTNTPWHERRVYLLVSDPSQKNLYVTRHRFLKDFHVSPFMPLKLTYDWRFGKPEKKCIVHANIYQKSEKLFDASLSLERIKISHWNMSRMILKYPFQTTRIVWRIHYQALKLWLRGIPFQSHPKYDSRLKNSYITGVGPPGK